MSKRNRKRGAAARDRPAGGRNGEARAAATSPGAQRGVVWLGEVGVTDNLSCSGYTSLAHSPDVSAGVNRIAALIGSMPLHLMRNGKKADIREENGLSRIVDISPSANQTRAMLMRWIVRTLYFGDGNAVVFPRTEGGFLRSLHPIPRAYCSFYPEGLFGYRVAINGQPYDPAQLLHFTLNPGDFYPWLGEGVRVTVSDIANNLKQAASTERAFMESKWKPSVIVQVDALTEEFSGPEGRKKLLDGYVTGTEAGEPWIIPAEQFKVQTVRPLTLSDLALSDFVKLDKRAVASVLGVPPFVLGVGEFNEEEWKNFISSYIMPLADAIAQELTKKLLYSPDLFFRFKSRALINYDPAALVNAGKEMVDRMALRRNEWRDWLDMPYDEEMEPLLALENYIPADRLGDQNKLTGGETDA